MPVLQLQLFSDDVVHGALRHIVAALLEFPADLPGGDSLLPTRALDDPHAVCTNLIHHPASLTSGCRTRLAVLQLGVLMTFSRCGPLVSKIEFESVRMIMTLKFLRPIINLINLKTVEHYEQNSVHALKTRRFS